MLGDPTAQHFGPAQPAAERHQRYEIGVLVGFHRVLHLVLRGLEFFLQNVPLFTVGEFREALAAIENFFADAEAFPQRENVLAEILHLLRVLGFHSDVSIGDQTAEIQRHLTAIPRGRERRAIFCGPIHFPELVQSGEQFARRRDGKRVDFASARDFLRGERGRGGDLRGGLLAQRDG